MLFFIARTKSHTLVGDAGKKSVLYIILTNDLFMKQYSSSKKKSSSTS